MKVSQMLSTFNGLFLSSNVVAATVLSPYVDLTLNTHWDSQTQQIQPMDLVTPALNHNIKAYHLAFKTNSGQCQPARGGQSEYLVNKGWGIQQSDLLTKKGIKINVSFGGANGTDISLACTDNN